MIVVELFGFGKDSPCIGREIRKIIKKETTFYDLRIVHFESAVEDFYGEYGMPFIKVVYVPEEDIEKVKSVILRLDIDVLFSLPTLSEFFLSRKKYQYIDHY